MLVRPYDAQQDSAAAGLATPYDTIWTEVPTQEPVGTEQVMLAEDKLYVVLAVVLIIWFGLVYFVFRTDRRLRRLERSLEAGIPEQTEG